MIRASWEAENLVKCVVRAVWVVNPRNCCHFRSPIRAGCRRSSELAQCFVRGLNNFLTFIRCRSCQTSFFFGGIVRRLRPDPFFTTLSACEIHQTMFLTSVLAVRIAKTMFFASVSCGQDTGSYPSHLVLNMGTRKHVKIRGFGNTPVPKPRAFTIKLVQHFPKPRVFTVKLACECLCGGRMCGRSGRPFHLIWMQKHGNLDT